MSRRAIYLDRAPGEIRGVVTLDDAPERLILRRDDDDLGLLVGARHAARVGQVEPAIGLAFLAIGDGAQAVLPFKTDAKPRRGDLLEIEIRAEATRDKLSLARLLGPAEGAPRLLAEPPDLASQLAAFAGGGEPITGRRAREAADEAEAEVLAVTHGINGGGDVAIEPTRALVAVDIDLGARTGADSKRVTRQANLAALPEIARLLRLKGLGGLVVVDLVGRGHDGTALMAAARAAFAPDNPGVAIGRIGRFGTMEIALPRRSRPVIEALCGPDGAPSDRTLAQRVVRRLADEGQSQPGARLVAHASPAVAAATQPLVAQLSREMGARFSLVAEGGFPRERFVVAAE